MAILNKKGNQKRPVARSAFFHMFESRMPSVATRLPTSAAPSFELANASNSASAPLIRLAWISAELNRSVG